jgi:biopolymer transport protein ExbD
MNDIYPEVPRRRKREDAEMDMTPMVDVVFLLLIFFMITTSFGLQKAIELPVPDKEQNAKQASTPKQPEDQDAEIVVNVTKENRIFVEGEEAPTRQELYARLRDRQHQGGRQTNRLLVVAESQASHEFVVRAIDAGNVVGMESVRIQTTD